MNIQAALVYLLTHDAGVSALIGTKMYPHQAPQRADPNDPADAGATPYLTYFLVPGTRRKLTQDGDAGIAFGRVQLECWGATPLEARTVADAVLVATDGNGRKLNGFKGATMGMGDSACVVQMCRLENDRDDFQPPQHGTETGYPCVRIDAVCVFEER